MFSVYFKGEQKRKGSPEVKISLIFYKSGGYNRIPKVVNITGPFKQWDNSSETFRGTSKEATEKNAALLKLKLKYIKVAEKWEEENVNWHPRQLAHYFDEPQEQPKSIKIISVLEFLEKIIEENKSRIRYKNSISFTSEGNARNYIKLRNKLQKFVKDTYNRTLSTYYFTDINETFLKEFVQYSITEGQKKGNKGCVTTNLRKLRALCVKAAEAKMCKENKNLFDCVAAHLEWPETEPRVVSKNIIKRIEYIDRTLFDDKEQLMLDMFLFSYYAGGMAPIDICSLTWNSVTKVGLEYERVKFNAVARPLLIDAAWRIIEKYRGTGYKEYVFPAFTEKHTSTKKQLTRVNNLCTAMRKTLDKACDILGIDEKMKWYTARGSFITKMCMEGHSVWVVADMSGNSPKTIQHHYYKTVNHAEILKAMNASF